MRSLVNGVTVDAAKARDLDDAFWVERRLDGGFRATVSIADVASLVPIGSLDDELAFRRGLTVYEPAQGDLPPQKSAMLIPQIARGQASLLPGRDRPVVSHIADFSAAGELLGFALARATLRSKAKFSYDEFEAVLAAQGELADMARLALELAGMLWRERIALAGQPEWGAAFDLEGKKLAAYDPGMLGQTIVHELMVLANVCGTEIVRARGMPMIYRNQGPRAGGPAGRYEVVCHGHQALGKPAYGPFTNPIRRFTDLVNQRILCAAAEQGIKGPGAPYDVVSLVPICAAANRAMQRAEAIGRRPEATGPQGRGPPPLDRLDADAFRHTATLDIGIVSPNTSCGRDLERRANDGLLSHADLAWIIFGMEDVAAPEFRVSILHRLSANPGDMGRVWEAGQKQFGAPPFELSSREADGQWMFVASTEDHVAYGTAQDPVRARGLALLHLAAAISGLDMPPDLDAGRGLLLAEIHAKSKLVYLCRMMNWSGPQFIIEDKSEGVGSHFSGHVEVKVDTFLYRSPVVHASTCRGAEGLSSVLALTALDPYADCLLADEARRDGVDLGILEDGLDADRPLTALRDFCRRYGAKQRCVWLAEQPSAGYFECVIELSAGENTLRAKGIGSDRLTAMEAGTRNVVTMMLDPGRIRRAEQRSGMTEAATGRHSASSLSVPAMS